MRDVFISYASSDQAVSLSKLIAQPTASYSIVSTAWGEWPQDLLSDKRFGLYLFDISTLDDVPNEIVTSIAAAVRRSSISVPIVFLTNHAPPPGLATTIKALIGDIPVYFENRATFTPGKINDMVKESAASYTVEANRQSSPHDEISPRSAFPHLTPEVRNPRSGRLDVKLISELFAIPLKRLLNGLGVQSIAAYKTPDAPSLQNSLGVYERIARSLLGLTGSAAGLRIWLNTPEPDLGNEIPLALLLNGEGEAIADLLEDMQEGQPG